MNNDQVIIDRDKLENLEKLESNVITAKNTRIDNLHGEIKKLQQNIEDISQGKVAQIQVNNFNFSFSPGTTVEFIHPENVKEVVNFKQIYDKNKILINDNRKLESMNFYQFMFKKRSLYNTIKVWIFMLGFIVLGSAIIDLIIKGIKIILK